MFESYDRALQALQALITDPEGRRYFVEKDPATRLREFEEQLARSADFLAFAGDPQLQYNTIHIAGTSGKSSLTTILAAILTRSGQRTGHHVSPYLQIPNEKLIVDGKMISREDFVRLVERFLELHAAWGASLTPFTRLRYGEAWVAITFLWFAMQQVDWAVIETGVGGRFDPTNVLDSSMAIITNVNYDHTNVLGTTLPEIARHKAGIIRPEGLVVSAETKLEALLVIEEEAARQKAHLYRLGRDFDFIIHESTTGGTKFTVQAPHKTYPDLNIPLRGSFQPLNAATAIAALDVLASAGCLNAPLSLENVRSALSSVHFPGRMEVVQHNPTVILDGAHNPHKMRALVESFQELYPGRRATILFGSLLIKDARAMLEALLPISGHFFFAPNPVYGKPGMPPEDLRAALQTLAPGLPAEITPNPHTAIETALASLPADGLLLVTGSIYFIGAARGFWHPAGRLLEGRETMLAR